MERTYDLIVIGTGSGLDVANAMAMRGWRVAIVERDRMGGTCLNRGCIPSKMLIHSADVIEVINKAHLFGIHVNGYEVDYPSIVRRVTQFVDDESGEIEHGLKSIDNPRLYQSDCKFVGHKKLQVGNDTLVADKILIASGGRPAIPNINGLRESGFITSDEALRLTKQPEVLTILGGGYIAAEMAHFFGSLGTKINIIQRRNVLVPREDEEIASKFTELIRQKYNVFTDIDVDSVSKKDGVFLVRVRNRRTNQTEVVRSDELLVGTGRTPNSDGLDVEKTGVRTDERGYIVTNEYLETNVEGIYSLGDAVGHFLFKHTANHEAQYVFNNFVDPQNAVAVDYDAMPHAIFASPQIAGVGKTEQALKAEKADYLVGRYEYYNTAMGKTIEDRTGLVKILVQPGNGKILGCHIVGTEASTLIHEAIVAMKSGDGSVRNLTRSIHIHPALPEVVQRAAYNLEHPSGHVHE